MRFDVVLTKTSWVIFFGPPCTMKFSSHVMCLYVCRGHGHWLQWDRRVLEHDFPRRTGPLLLHFAVRYIVIGHISVFLHCICDNLDYSTCVYNLKQLCTISKLRGHIGPARGCHPAHDIQAENIEIIVYEIMCLQSIHLLFSHLLVFGHVPLSRVKYTIEIGTVFRNN